MIGNSVVTGAVESERSAARSGNTEHQLDTEQKCFVALQPMLSYTSNHAPGIPTLNGLNVYCKAKYGKGYKIQINMLCVVYTYQVLLQSSAH